MSSFGEQAKDELARLWPLASSAAAWSELAGLVRAAGRLHVAAGGPYLELTHEQASVARKSYRLLREVADTPAEIWARRLRRLRRDTLYGVRVPGGPPLDRLCRRLGVRELRLPARLTSGRACQAAFLRGLFLGCGSLGDPEAGHHLELALAPGPLGDAAEAVLAQLGLAPRRTRRRGGGLVYWKSGESICEFLRLVGARQSLFAYEEARIWAQVRNDVNRLVNADTANVGKSVRASVRQVEDIRLLAASVGLGGLPRSLREIAEARLAHPDLSLVELGRLLDPPVGKSGANHRLREIGRLATSLRGGGGPGGESLARASAKPSRRAGR